MRVWKVGYTESTEMLYSFHRGHREDFEVLTLRGHRGPLAVDENFLNVNKLKRTIKFIRVPSQLQSYLNFYSDHASWPLSFHRGHREDFEVLTLRGHRGPLAVDEKIQNGVKL